MDPDPDVLFMPMAQAAALIRSKALSRLEPLQGLPVTVKDLFATPAAVFPSGFGGDGLPTATQVVGPWGSDGAVLRLGAVLEQDRPWAHRRPSLA